jgi:hypothetical protein
LKVIPYSRYWWPPGGDFFDVGLSLSMTRSS